MLHRFIAFIFTGINTSLLYRKKISRAFNALSALLFEITLLTSASDSKISRDS
jgi:hypothetical protein